MRRRKMFPESSFFVANYILSKPRSDVFTRTARSPYEDSPRLVLPSFRTPRLGLKDYWLSPQRSYSAGSTWRTAHRQLMVFPGNTGVSDVSSSHMPACCHLHHPLVWKYRWQKLHEQMRRVRY